MLLGIGAGFLLLGALLMLLPFGFSMTGLCLAALGAVCVVLWIFRRRGVAEKWRDGLLLVTAAGIIFLEAGMGIVAGTGMADLGAVRQADYAVVLGAQVRGTEPSPILRYRLNAALAFLAENPQGKIVVSGGQGADEQCSEAAAMTDYLVAHGADPARILQEDQAENTQQNLRLSQAVIAADGGDPREFVIITSEFHMARAKFIAATLGVQASGMSAQSEQWIYKINYDLREVFAFVKAVLEASY